MATWLRAAGWREPADFDAVETLEMRRERLGNGRYLYFQSAQNQKKPVKNHQATDLLDGTRVFGDAILARVDEVMRREHKTNVSRIAALRKHYQEGVDKNTPWMVRTPLDDEIASVVFEPETIQAAWETEPPYPGVTPNVTEAISISESFQLGNEFCLSLYASPKQIVALVVTSETLDKAFGSYRVKSTRVEVQNPFDENGVVDISISKVWDADNGWGCHSELRWRVCVLLEMFRALAPPARHVNGVKQYDCMVDADVYTRVVKELVDRARAEDDDFNRAVTKLEQTLVELPKKLCTSSKERRRATVAGFMQMQQSIMEAAMAGSTAYTAYHGDPELQDVTTRYLAANVSRMRLYEFDPNVLVRMCRATVTRLLGDDCKGSDWPALTRAMQDPNGSMLKEMPPPPKERPSEFMYIAFGEGVQVTGPARLELLSQQRRSGRTHLTDDYEVALLGYGIMPDVVFTIIEDFESVGMLTVWNGPLVQDESLHGWVPNLSLAAWTIPWLLDLLSDDANRVIQDGFAAPSGRVKRTAKQLSMDRPTPRPFYTVHVNHNFDRQRRGKGVPRSIRAEFKHRWPVDAHTRMYVQRGMLPLVAADRAKLLKRRYTICEGRVDERCAAGLALRRHPPQKPGEWMAYRFVRVKEHLSPNRDDLPIIPSVKRVKRVQIEE